MSPLKQTKGDSNVESAAQRNAIERAVEKSERDFAEGHLVELEHDAEVREKARRATKGDA